MTTDTSKCGGVLVVDDDDDIRDAMCELLEDEGYKVESAANGRDALELLRYRHPCLMLLDLRMPVMDGFQVLDQVKHSPELNDISIAVVSAEHIQPDGSEASIPKPIDVERLLATVRRCCRPGEDDEETMRQH